MKLGGVAESLVSSHLLIDYANKDPTGPGKVTRFGAALPPLYRERLILCNAVTLRTGLYSGFTISAIDHTWKDWARPGKCEAVFLCLTTASRRVRRWRCYVSSSFSPLTPPREQPTSRWSAVLHKRRVRRAKRRRTRFLGNKPLELVLHMGDVLVYVETESEIQSSENRRCTNKQSRLGRSGWSEPENQPTQTGWGKDNHFKRLAFHGWDVKNQFQRLIA